jgi:hypothetical protein
MVLRRQHRLPNYRRTAHGILATPLPHILRPLPNRSLRPMAIFGAAASLQRSLIASLLVSILTIKEPVQLAGTLLEERTCRVAAQFNNELESIVA